MASAYVLAIDQGTTSTRAVVFNEQGQSVGSAQREFTQRYPQAGWVEHDALEIWRTVTEVVPEALSLARINATDLVTIGITNQRETIVLWDRKTGAPVAPALVWQDRRTADFCRDRRGDENWLRERTGLVLDPYFSATKIRWLLTKLNLHDDAAAGKLAVGTIDTWLLWNLTGGAEHATDVSNASRTLLFNLQARKWDDELCHYFGVSPRLLPRVQPSASSFGNTASSTFLPAGIPISGIAGDQQAALFGQGCFQPGEGKCTYGTGAFFLLHIGSEPRISKHRLLTSLAATTSPEPEYVLEGSVFIAGAAVQWLRDGLGILARSAETEGLAEAANAEHPILLVPGFVGLGAPHWVPDVRGVLFGLTRDTGPADLARAALEGVAFQVVDLLSAADQDFGHPIRELRVDGGMTQNRWFLQRQADLWGHPVYPSLEKEATALGAAFLAGLHEKVWPDRGTLAKLNRTTEPFLPRMAAPEREKRLRQWHRAVNACIQFYSD